METLGDALAKRKSKVEVPQCCFEGYGLEQVGSKGSAPESCPRPVEESRTDAEGSKMNDEEEDDEYSSESSGEEHVDVPSTGTKKESDEFSDEPRTEALEGEESEEEYSDEYSEDEYSEISADEASGANKEAEKEESREGDSANPASPCDSNEEVDKDTGSAEKEERSAQGSGEERVDVSSTGANKEVLNEKDEYSYGSGSEALEGEESEDDEYSDEDECSSQHSAAEYNGVNAGGAEADEASGANEEAEKEEPVEIMVSMPEGGDFMCPAPPRDLQEAADKDSGSAEKDDRPLEASGEERMSSTGANNGALNEKDEYSDGSGSEGLEGEEGEEDEYSDEDECSSQHSAAEHNDVIAGGVEANEASGANEEAEKEEPAEIMVSVPEGGDFMCPAPPFPPTLLTSGFKASGQDATEEAEKKEPPEIGSKVDGEDHGSPDPTNPDPVCGSQDEVGDAQVNEQLSQQDGELIAGGIDPANPVSDAQEEVRDAEVDEHSSPHSAAEYHDVMGSEAAADANEEAEKNESLEIVSKVDGEDHAANPDPVSDLQEEVRDAEVDEHSSHHSTAEYHDVMGSEAEADANGNEEAEKNESLEIVSKVDGEDHAANPDPANESQEEVHDAEVDEHSSHHSTAEYHDVTGSEAAADANEEAEKTESPEIASKADGEDHAANRDPVSDLQEEVRDAEVDEHSSLHSTAEYHDVMGSEAEADDASGPKEGVEKEEPADIALNVEHDAGYPEATSGTSHSAQSHLPQVFDIGSPKADEPGAEEATDEAAAAAEDDDFVAPHPDEKHLDVPSTETTKLHQECEDPDESGSECSDDEDSEASAYEVGDSDEEADKVETVNVTSTVDDPDCDGAAQQRASLPEIFDIGSMDDSAPEADEPSEPKAEAAESAEAAAAEAKTEAAAAQAAAELEEAAAAEDSPKQNPDVRLMSQTDPQVNSSDKKMSMRIERTSADSQLVNPSAGLAKPSHAAGIGGSRALTGTGSTATDVLQRRGSMSLLEDPLGHTAQTVPQAQASGAMASGTQTGIDSVPGPVMKREVALCGRTVLEDGPWLPLRFQAATEVPVSVKPDASGRTHTLPSSLLTRDPTKPRPKKTLRFSEHVDHRSISPRPRSATAPEASGMEDKKRTAQSGPSTATKPVPVQSSSFSEFLFLPPVPENKTEPPQSLSNFLFAPNGSTAQHAVPAVEMESSRRSGEEHHASSAHHHGSDAHDSSPSQVDPMGLEAHERDLACSLERRVLERAYFLFQNGHSDDQVNNYYTALRIEMSLSA